MSDLKNNVKYVKGVGEARAKTLNKLGIYSLEDLITYYPRSYEDRSKIKKIKDIVDGEKITIEVRAITPVTVRMLGRYKSIEKATFSDETGDIVVTWFNQPYISKQIKRGEMYRLFGKVTANGLFFEMNSPVFDPIDKKMNTGKIVPVYPLTSEIKASTMRRIISNGLSITDKLDEIEPEYIVKKYNLMDYDTSIRQIHFPDN